MSTLPSRVRLPRVWCTHPIVRSPNLVVQWLNGTGDVRFVCDAPGANAQVSWLRRPQIPHAEHNRYGARREPRLPTGLCSAVLTTAIALAQKHGTDTLEFPSLRELHTVATGLPKHMAGAGDFYIHAIRDAIRLWQVMAIDWERISLPPPFEQVELGQQVRRNGQRSISITLNREWLRAAKGGVGVKLRLPTQAFSHNIILSTLASGSARVLVNKFGYRASGNKLCLRSTPLMPNPTWKCVKEWYERQGGMIDYRPDPPTIHPHSGRLTPGKMMTITVIKP